MNKIFEKLYDYLPTLGIAIAIFILGIILAKIIVKIMGKALNKSKIDITAHSFLKSLVKVSLYALVTIIALTMLGVPTTSLVTIVGAAGLAVGLALQSSMSNLAGGFIILFSKPFKVGDYVQVGSSEGKVEAITILYTRLLTGDNKVVYIPNGQVSNSSIVNFTQEETRRLDLVFSISYDADYIKAKKILANIVDKNDLALKDPEPLIRVSEQAASSINIAVRIWVKSEDYWTLNFDMLEAVKTRFDEESIAIPYNQLDVQIKQ